MATVSIHRLDKEATACFICQRPLVAPPLAKPGEFVGAVESPQTTPIFYRIGENNKDPLCDGTPAQDFYQSSLPNE